MQTLYFVCRRNDQNGCTENKENERGVSMQDRKLEAEDIKKFREELEKCRAGNPTDKVGDALTPKQIKKLKKEMEEARKNTR